MIRWRMIGVVVAAAGVAGGFSALWAAAQPASYEVEVVMAVAPSSTLTADADVIDVVGSLDRGGITATAAGVAASGSVRDGAVADLGLAPGEAKEYEIDAVPVLSSNLIDISVSGPDARVVADLANAVGARLQTTFAAIYDVYEVEVLTAATPPTGSNRPDAALVTVLGALVGGSLATGVLWAGFAGRWHPAASPADEAPDRDDHHHDHHHDDRADGDDGAT